MFSVYKINSALEAAAAEKKRKKNDSIWLMAKSPNKQVVVWDTKEREN